MGTTAGEDDVSVITAATSVLNTNDNGGGKPAIAVSTDVGGGSTPTQEKEKKVPSYQSPYTSPPPSPFPALVSPTSTSTSTPTTPFTPKTPTTPSSASGLGYDPTTALLDLPGVSYALQAFLSSQMFESEAFLEKEDARMERMYVATGYGLIQCVKGLMSYEDKDLLAGIQHTKQGNHIASLHRKKQAFLGSRLAGYVVSSVSSALHHDSDASVQWIKSMTDVERHAELTYAESLFEKALLGIVYSGDWLAFIKEALNMRTTISIYRQLHAYIEHMDAIYAKSHPRPADSKSKRHIEDPSIDVHFRSGVLLGVGMSNIILSLMPGKLQTLVELFGYKGDRKLGLDALMRVGGWDIMDEDSDEPAISASEEGVRRSICDMALLIFHLVLSSFTFEGVDIGVADRILKWNLKRYPNGVFFLFGAGRLNLTRSQPARAIAYYTQAMAAQKQYRNLHHISWWEIAIANLALWEVGESLRYWRDLEREATWSKAIYSYGMAVCLLEISKTEEDPEKKKENIAEAAKLMERVPGLRQKIAGKSIPLEKFVSRKARKFSGQNNRLCLPALELAYIFQGIAHAPRKVILEKMLKDVVAALKEMGWTDTCLDPAPDSAGASNEKENEKEKESERGIVKEAKIRKHIEKKRYGKGYWDDYCLAMFLRGVCLRYVAYPDPDAELDPKDEVKDTPLSKEIAERESEASFRAVFEHGPKIELDHHLVYHAHYELGRLLACQIPTCATPSLASEKKDKAKAEFDLVLSGKYLEVGSSGKKGKYSMENALHMRTHAAVDVLLLKEGKDAVGRGKKGRL
ncbi:hypothetical protein CPC08DRAFT_737445 [Agrocybe pediades]|nr:hypothetical protein CPC08DRAFT_737445 [Agrocybe pediades]